MNCFHPPWSCVSPPRHTASSGWKSLAFEPFLLKNKTANKAWCGVSYISCIKHLKIVQSHNHSFKCELYFHPFKGEFVDKMTNNWSEIAVLMFDHRPQRQTNRSTWAKLNPSPTMLFNLNVHPLEGVSRFRDPQLQVGGNHSYLLNLGPTFANVGV